MNRAEEGRMVKGARAEDEMVRALLDFNTEKKRLKTIINCVANGIMVTNVDLEVILQNPALRRMLNITADLKNPFPVSEIIQNDSLMETLRKIQAGEVHEDEVICQEIQIGKNTLRAISTPNLAPDRRIFWAVVGAVTVFEDITLFKQLDQMKSDFVHMVAHELRSPLVSIRQMNSVLLEGMAGVLQDKQRDFIQRGTKKIDTLLALINDLLDMAKIEAAQHVRTRVPTDLTEVAREAVALMQARAEAQGITLTCSCDALKPVQADPKYMEEIFNNLISNAINYSPEGGRVNVSISGRGPYAEIKVEDTGVGIAPEELPKIFDKFYRVKDPKTRRISGTGLGLAIVKGIVEAHSGTIEVESVPDQGTSFTIRLPVGQF